MFDGRVHLDQLVAQDLFDEGACIKGADRIGPVGRQRRVRLVIGIGIALYYFQWQDDHSILTVRLHREGQARPIEYQIYKYHLAERSFTTLDGILVTVASSERMEVEGL